MFHISLTLLRTLFGASFPLSSYRPDFCHFSQVMWGIKTTQSTLLFSVGFRELQEKIFR